ncbi:gluconokinase [Shewanella waksmanii]|uniref:gluconokinase n=1 Tax=Shewanella waksmanii TaxID=213783 RepID=UPI00373636E9
MGSSTPQLIIIMGISGSGKSLLAKLLAKQLNACFLDADDYHSPEAKQKMANGHPLTEQDRAPWIARLIAKIATKLQQGTPCVMAYSGLKAHHRQQFIPLCNTACFIHLDPAEAVIKSRLSARQNHFFNPNLLASQISAFEAPEQQETLYRIDQDLPPEQLLQHAMEIIDAHKQY